MDVSWVIDAALEIVYRAGRVEEFSLDGVRCIVRTYEDPWNGGLLIRYGGPSGLEFLTVHNDYGDGACLLRVAFDGDNVYLHEFDETTAWTLYLSACLTDVRDSG